ncbi:MAG: hypothetical protein BHW64_00380 [Candidatus Melainabacteria bacterium LEY3_CP_29_8]|nr:MAG: hypothetical protein BHW64_00380 [Candidatus Melainabacteria bacterium LEY3_CP_29_8]
MSSGLNPFSSGVQSGNQVYQINFEQLKNMQMISHDNTCNAGFQVSQDVESKIASPNMEIDFDINSEMQKFI